ncbi:MAG: NAD-dependent epimerase/dehydratase [Candidatus Latescibacterota bacterium]|nr:MAG: NAD-dependent epimerase/dehydratase [Candidatus Latescibacterota bacterium]
MKTVVVTGGAGYVGSALVPELLENGYRVKVVDLMLYGESVLDSVKDHEQLDLIKGDIRDRAVLETAIAGADSVIHLACISNDPSYELNPALGKSINYDAFIDLVDVSRRSGVERFVYASSSSVYGVKDEPDVTEDLPREPLTDYSLYKAKCEDHLSDNAGEMTYVVVRPSTVCGYAPRLRLDLTVNILTNHALNKRVITVFGGEQKRPNIHIRDMVDAYLMLLKQPHDRIHRKIYNVGYQNFKVREIAELVKSVIGSDINIKTVATDDNRSYHVSSEKIKRELGFVARHTVEEAVEDLREAFDAGLVPNPMDDIRYYNVKLMKEIDLK